MNANELADVMEKYSVAGFQYPLCDEFKQAAAMLRLLDGQLAFRIDAVKSYQIKVEQQQAEIEALKAENKFFKDLMGDVEILKGKK